MPPKKKLKAAKFLKKDVDGMVKRLFEDEDDCHDVTVEEAIKKLKDGIHLSYKDARKQFVNDLVCNDDAKKHLYICAKTMVKDYIHLLKQYSKGKRFAQFEQAWMSHINDFFDDSSGGCSRQLWKNVMDQTITSDKTTSTVSVEEQRIVVSSLMYAIYDIMTGKVKAYKEDTDDDHVDSTAAPASTPDVFFESNVSLYRYGGFALHSLLQKYKHEKEGDTQGNIITFLKQLAIKPDQMTMVPQQIHDLNQGGLVIMNPCMLPYLRVLIERVSSLVNDKRCQEFGKSMIKAASIGIENDKEISRTFIECVKECGIEISPLIFPRIYNKITKKMFHARVNEYMTASIEVQLEKTGKVVNADQGLRDELKTFSAKKRRQT